MWQKVAPFCSRIFIIFLVDCEVLDFFCLVNRLSPLHQLSFCFWNCVWNRNFFTHNNQINLMVNYVPAGILPHQQVPSISSCLLPVQLKSPCKWGMISPNPYIFAWVFLVAFFPQTSPIPSSLQGTLIPFTTHDLRISFVSFLHILLHNDPWTHFLTSL